ncbi:hypothetical protein GCM10027088_67980 [Nocardia goodfellowii]|uniref:Uncharacterized protein n=1 Tax=Nocardia goodfellowii TaxID=882446 RepID=A0ABS4QMP1_9NOCA|nr:hypothetical protein [Nocardia goodfellowii]
MGPVGLCIVRAEAQTGDVLVTVVTDLAGSDPRIGRTRRFNDIDGAVEAVRGFLRDCIIS